MSTYWPLGVCTGKEVSVPFFGRTVGFAPGAVLPFKVAEFLALQTDYGAFLNHRVAAGNLEDVQCDACRVIRGGSGPVTEYNHSEHAHSVAFDIRPFANPMSDAGVLHFDYDRFSTRDGIAFVNAFKSCLIAWGGDWSTSTELTPKTFGYRGKVVPGLSRVDSMHFELHMSPLQVREHNWEAVLRDAGMSKIKRAAFVKRWMR